MTMLAPFRTVVGCLSSVKNSERARGKFVKVRVQEDVTPFASSQNLTATVSVTAAAAKPHTNASSSINNNAGRNDGHEQTVGPSNSSEGRAGDGPGGDADGNGGGGHRGGGGGGRSNGGSRGGVPPFRLTASHMLAAFVSYVAALVGAATAWDAILDSCCPRVDTSNATVSVIIPALNEERLIADTVRHVLLDLHPQPLEVIVVDGGSTDGTVKAALWAGAVVVRSSGRGRGLQMNAGAAAARGQLLVFLHADTKLPEDALSEVRVALSSPRTVLVGFRPLIVTDKGRPMVFSTLNNLTKTWYGPVLLRPASFVRGLRVMFGDQVLSCRAADLRHVGGYRADIPFMEDAELCIALHEGGPSDEHLHRGRGRIRMLLHRSAATSGRRIAAWGEARANLVFVWISLMWLAGASPEQLHSAYRQLYQDVR